MFLFIHILFLNFILEKGEADDYVINNKRFPSNFMFGVATSSYQVEGGWNADGKSPNIWDNLTHSQPDFILDGSNGDVACDSYNKIKDDIILLNNLQVNHYRFSISWSRILPQGVAGARNEKGIAYYKNLIKELKHYSIEPVVTLYHWDLPQTLQDQGGFLNESMIKWFSDYVRICFEEFGDDVKYWITFNEAKQVCYGGYGAGYEAPAIKSEGLLEYVCAHTLLKAHAAAWHLYDEEFRAKQRGKISITIDTSWYEPASNSTEDITAAETKMQFEFGWYAHPIFLGDYPEIVKTRIAQRSKAEGYNQSRLPEFTQAEILYIRGTHDFLGLNTYTTSMVKAIPEPPVVLPPSHDSDIGVEAYFSNEWTNTTLGWLKIVPWGMRKLLTYIKNTLNDPDIIITENGVCDTGTMDDEQRVFYITNYVSYLRDAMEKDGVKVIGYTVWSLMDNFEWAAGYTQKFGLYYVDFDSNNRERIPKKSAIFYQKLAQSRCLIDRCID